ncbi:MAG TPA: protealysin inhibitor emfourin [Bordetella sp.]|nr:protealysin inhibitor emfourin [Bordetella sp.]
MIELPPLSDATLVRVSRQGGLAYVPARAAPRDIDLRACPEDQRRDICQALRQAAPVAMRETELGGDQRYFRIEIWFVGDTATVRFQVPESQAPEPLLRLWKRL